MIKKLWKRAVTRQTAAPFFKFGETGISSGLESSVEAALSFYERLICEVNLRVVKEDGQPDPGHRLNGLLLSPDPSMNRGQFFARVCRNVLLKGNCYIQIGPANDFLKLVWNSDDVSVSQNGEGEVNFYQTKNRYVHPENMIHIREIKGDRIAEGRSKLETLAATLSNIHSKQQFLSQWAFQSKGFLKGAPVKSQDAKEFAARLEKFITSDKFNILSIAEKGDLKSFSPDSKIDDFIKFQTAMRQAVFQIFGLPLFLASSEKLTSYKSGTESLNIFVRTSFSGLLSLIEAAFSFKLLSEIERKNSYSVQFDLSKLLRSDRETEAKNIMVLRQAGVISPNDGRAILGLPPAEGADYLTPAPEGKTE